MQAQLFERERHPSRLIGIGRQRSSRRHIAELTRPGADVAEDHDGERAPTPALTDVGTASRFADGVKLLAVDQLADLEEGLSRR